MPVEVKAVSLTEQVDFRLFQMPCCGMLYCHVNPRLPNYCPECGERCYIQLKSGEHTLKHAPAWLKIQEPR